MVNSLLDEVALSELPGAPFSERAVDAAVANIRGSAGWHIAPRVTETLTLDSEGGTRLILPTLKLVSVSAVRDTSGTDPVAITDYRMSTAGILFRAAGWPCGFGAVEVDLTHGHGSCPLELLPVIAAECKSVATGKNLASTQAGIFSATYRDADPLVDPALARYTLPSRP